MVSGGTRLVRSSKISAKDRGVLKKGITRRMKNENVKEEKSLELHLEAIGFGQLERI